MTVAMRAFTKHGDSVHLAEGRIRTLCHRKFDRWADPFLERRPVNCRHCLRAIARAIAVQQRVIAGEA